MTDDMMDIIGGSDRKDFFFNLVCAVFLAITDISSPFV
jgi:hypothetical protein